MIRRRENNETELSHMVRLLSTVTSTTHLLSPLTRDDLERILPLFKISCFCVRRLDIMKEFSSTRQRHCECCTRSSAIRRESAHLTWLYCTVLMAFQHKHGITSVTGLVSGAICRINTKTTSSTRSRDSVAVDSLRPVLTHSFGVNP